MKAQFVYENINFERGVDPKKSMEIGAASLPRIIGQDHYNEGRKTQLTNPELHKVFSDPTNPKHLESGYGFYISFSGEEGTKYYWLEELINLGGPFLFDEKIYDFSGMTTKIQENINFERGQDPKTALGIGLSYDNLRPGNILSVKKDIDNRRQVGYKIKVKEVTDVEKMIGSQRPGKEIDYVVVDKNGEQISNIQRTWTMGKEWFDEHFDIIGLVKESINFERGQDPKSALGIGIIIVNQVWRFSSPTGLTGMGPGYTERFIEEILRMAGDDNIPKRYNNVAFKTPDNKLIFLRDLLGRNIKDEYSGKIFKIPQYSEFPAEGNMYYTEKGRVLRDPDQSIIDFTLRENINFERGKDPKTSLGIGLSFDNLQAGNILMSNKDMSWGKAGRKLKVKSVEELDSGFKEIGYVNIDINGKVSSWPGNTWQFYKEWFDEHFDIVGLVKESISFERGKDPKDALEVGSHRIPKKGETFTAWDRFNKKMIQVIADFDSKSGDDFYSEYDFNTDGEMRYTGANQPEWWTEVSFPDGGENFAVKFKGKGWEIDNDDSDEDLNENLSFERGKDPKETMDIGLKSKAVEIDSIRRIEKIPNTAGEIKSGVYLSIDQTHHFLSNLKNNDPRDQENWRVIYYVDKELILRETRPLHAFSGQYMIFDGIYYFIPEVNLHDPKYLS